MAEEELWINEKVQQLSVPDDDLDWSAPIAQTTAKASSSSIRPQIVENEMNAHRNLQFAKLAQYGRQLIDANNLGHEQISQRLVDMDQKWADLAEFVQRKQKRLQDLHETKQFFLDVEDVDSYLYELSRMLVDSASDDYHLGRDETTVLNLLKKHKDLEEDFSRYKQVVQNVHDQANNLPSLKQLEQVNEPAEKQKLSKLHDQVQQRLQALERRYAELGDMFKLRKSKLNDQLSFIRLQNDTDGVEAWIDEKERFLATLDPTTVKDIEALEVIKHRFDGFEREMNSNAPKVAVVNKLAHQLVTSQQVPSQAGWSHDFIYFVLFSKCRYLKKRRYFLCRAN